MVRVIFVRAGNICRLQIAWGGFESVLRREGVEDGVEVDSAGTGDWHGKWAVFSLSVSRSGGAPGAYLSTEY